MDFVTAVSEAEGFHFLSPRLPQVHVSLHAGMSYCMSYKLWSLLTLILL